MQFLNNDMDDLMRRAADGYNPPVTGADWSKVVAELEGEDKKSFSPWVSNSRRFLFLFTFLLASLVCNRYLQVRWGHVQSMHTTPGKIQKEAQPIVNLQEDLKIDKRKNINKNHRFTDVQNISFSFYPSINSKMKREEEKDGEASIIAVKEMNGERLLSGGIATAPVRAYNAANALAKIHAIKKPVFQHPEVKQKEDRKKANKGFSIALVSGVEGNTIKGKEMKPGWNGGALLGYSFLPKWTVEGGVLWNRKNYYTDGKYFKTDRIALPNHSTVIYADGYCQTFEIPFTIRYQWLQKEKGAFFASIGSSSYLMQKEDYDYRYERYGVSYYGSKYYKKSSQHWLATFNISGGYQHKVGRLGSLRIEPYLKLPVSGMGIGSLPITSVGVQGGLVVPIQ